MFYSAFMRHLYYIITYLMAGVLIHEQRGIIVLLTYGRTKVVQYLLYNYLDRSEWVKGIRLSSDHILGLVRFNIKLEHM